MENLIFRFWNEDNSDDLIVNYRKKKKIISGNRTVKLLSDSLELMSETMKKETDFVEMLLEIKKENVDSIFKQIDEDNVKKACKIIFFSVKIRSMEVESFITLVSLISSKFGIDSLPGFSYYIRSLLIARGILPPPNDGRNYDKTFTIFETGSIKWAIREDNVEQFCSFITKSSFYAKSKLYFSSVDIEDSMLVKCESYMQLIAFFGAVNCFKQAIMNDAFSLDGISEFAVAGGNNEIVRILEQKGISFDNCFEIGVKYHRMDICDWLLMHTKNESIWLSTSLEYFNYPAFLFTMYNEESFDNALSIASGYGHFEVVEFLMEQPDPNVEAKDGDGRTPLHYASINGHLEVIKFLIERCHANVEAEDNFGNTALHFASENYNEGVIKFIDERTHTNVKDKSKKCTKLYFASEKSKIEVVKYLVEQCHANVDAKKIYGDTVLHSASSGGRIEVVKYLVEQCRANVKAKCNFGATPLRIASANGHIEVVKYLIEKCRANSKEKNSDGSTLLHIASANGHIEVVKYLIEKCRANVEAKDKDGKTPLQLAAYYGRVDVAEYLVKQCHAKVETEDDDRKCGI
jgi:ankyrin repeat protein